jgi:hypothetical protein
MLSLIARLCQVLHQSISQQAEGYQTYQAGGDQAPPNPESGVRTVGKETDGFADVP